MISEVRRAILLLLDLAVIAAALLAAYELRYTSGFFPLPGPEPGFEAYGTLLLLALVLWVPLFAAFRLDRFPGGWPAGAGRDLASIFQKTLQAVITFLMLLLALSYLQKFYYSRLLLLLFAILLLAGFVLVRLGARAVLTTLQKHGVGVRRAVIVGSPAVAGKVLRHLQRQTDGGYEIVGVLAPTNGAEESERAWNPVFSPSSNAVPDLLLSQAAQEVIFAQPLHGNSELLQLIARCQQRGLTVRLLPDFHEIYPFVELMEIGGLPFLEVRQSPRRGGLQRGFDLLVGAGLLVLLSPLLLSLTLLLLVVSRGRLLLRQTRVGQYGRPFAMYKFHNPAVVPASPPWKGKLGAFLDHYSLLELPQLFNVFQGTMGLVGPRPEKQERVRYYSEWNKIRLSLKPGITGYAQVHGLRGHTPSDEKTFYDLEYMARASCITDFFLLLKTVLAVLARGRRQPVVRSQADARRAAEAQPEEALLGGRPC